MSSHWTASSNNIPKRIIRIILVWASRTALISVIKKKLSKFL